MKGQVIKKEHKKLLKKLTQNKAFPITEKNTTEKEREQIHVIMSTYDKDEIKNVIRKEALIMKQKGLI